MRLATAADIPALEAIAIATLRTAWPLATFGDNIGLAYQDTRPEVILACSDLADAFILSERLDPNDWMVRFLMPLSMPAKTGTDLISFAMLAEHALRPLTATTRCFARLDQGSQVERGTASSYQTILASNSTPVLDAFGTVVATEIWKLAPDLAKTLKVRLP